MTVNQIAGWGLLLSPMIAGLIWLAIKSKTDLQIRNTFKDVLIGALIALAIIGWIVPSIYLISR